ncbi:hypothetical protein DSM21852_38190 [Methylocystis bryophila]|nr:hypothetical protein DSM21852_38190 [Methylocystis bryophila]
MDDAERRDLEIAEIDETGVETLRASAPHEPPTLERSRPNHSVRRIFRVRLFPKESGRIKAWGAADGARRYPAGRNDTAGIVHHEIAW